MKAKIGSSLNFEFSSLAMLIVATVAIRKREKNVSRFRGSSVLDGTHPKTRNFRCCYLLMSTYLMLSRAIWILRKISQWVAVMSPICYASTTHIQHEEREDDYILLAFRFFPRSTFSSPDIIRPIILRFETGCLQHQFQCVFRRVEG